MPLVSADLDRCPPLALVTSPVNSGAPRAIVDGSHSVAAILHRGCGSEVVKRIVVAVAVLVVKGSWRPLTCSQKPCETMRGVLSAVHYHNTVAVLLDGARDTAGTGSTSANTP